MKNRITLLICLTLLSTSLLSQSRVNRQKIKFNGSYEKMTSSIGWSYNETLGEWIDYQNVISVDKDYKTKFKYMMGGRMESHRDNNFLSLQIKTLMFKDVKYYVLIVKKFDGRYRYPSIMEDWIYWESTEGYIFTEKDYNKLKNIEGKIELKTEYRVILGSSYEEFDEIKFLDLIQTRLNDIGESSLNRRYSTYTFPILKTLSDQIEVIRFLLPHIPMFNNYDFKTEYFEVSPENFQKIIDIK